ncbi:MAG: hypothetical protein JJ992_29250, partial [Planctomycetes bacterium]|nr:hypothetical protein [Planctomycetota bacterium]
QAMQYEKAAVYRDILRAMESTSARQRVSRATSETSEDYISADSVGEISSVSVMRSREGRLISGEYFFLEHWEGVEESEQLRAFVRDFYALSTDLPMEINLPCELDEKEAGSTTLPESPHPCDEGHAADEASCTCYALADPFAERFDQEEVVIDRYASLQAVHGGATPTARKQREIASAMQAIFEDAPQPSPCSPDAPDSAVGECEVSEVAVSSDLSADDNSRSDSREHVESSPAAEISDLAVSEDAEERILQTLAEVGPIPTESAGEPANTKASDTLDEAADESCITLEVENQGEYGSGRVRVIRTPPPDDNDMIVVIDENRGETPLRPSGGIARRQEYRHLFSRLRQS